MEARGGKARNPLLSGFVLGGVCGFLNSVIGGALFRRGVSRPLSEVIGFFLIYVGVIWGVLTLFPGQRRVGPARRLGAAVLGALVGLAISWAINRLLFRT